MKHPPNTDSTAELYNYGLKVRAKCMELLGLTITSSEFDEFLAATLTKRGA